MSDTAEREAGHHDAEHQAEHHGHEKPGGEKGGAVAKAEGKLGKHRDLIIIVISIVGVVIAWVSYRHVKGGGASGSGAATAPDYTSGSGATPAGFVAGSGADTGASDGLLTLLSNMQHELDQLNTTIGATGAPRPKWTRPARYNSPRWAGEPASEKPHYLFGAAAKGLTYLRNLATGAVYQINPNGRAFKLNRRQYAALGKPTAITYGHKPTPPTKPAQRATRPVSPRPGSRP